MIYDAVYAMSSNMTTGLIAAMIIVVLTFVIVLFAARWADFFWMDAIVIALLVAFVIAIASVGEATSQSASFRDRMLADPEYQRILGDAHALDVEVNKLLERAREIRKQIKEKKKDGKRNNSVSGDAAK